MGVDLESIQVRLDLITDKFAQNMKAASNQLNTLLNSLRNQQDAYRKVSSRIRTMNASLNRYKKINQNLTSGQQSFINRQERQIANWKQQQTAIMNSMAATKKIMTTQKDQMMLDNKIFKSKTNNITTGIKQAKRNIGATQAQTISQMGLSQVF